MESPATFEVVLIFYWSNIMKTLFDDLPDDELPDFPEYLSFSNTEKEIIKNYKVSKIDCDILFHIKLLTIRNKQKVKEYLSILYELQKMEIDAFATVSEKEIIGKQLPSIPEESSTPKKKKPRK